jgi:hypothetical protein
MKTKRRSIEKEIEEKIPFVHSLFEVIGRNKLTKEEVHQKYIGFRPGSVFKKIFTPPVDLRTVDIYLKTLTEREYVQQEIAPWSESEKVKVILYSLLPKGLEFLNR